MESVGEKTSQIELLAGALNRAVRDLRGAAQAAGAAPGGNTAGALARLDGAVGSIRAGLHAVRGAERELLLHRLGPMLPLLPEELRGEVLRRSGCDVRCASGSLRDAHDACNERLNVSAPDDEADTDEVCERLVALVLGSPDLVSLKVDNWFPDKPRVLCAAAAGCGRLDSLRLCLSQLRDDYASLAAVGRALAQLRGLRSLELTLELDRDSDEEHISWVSRALKKLAPAAAAMGGLRRLKLGTGNGLDDEDSPTALCTDHLSDDVAALLSGLPGLRCLELGGMGIFAGPLQEPLGKMSGLQRLSIESQEVSGLWALADALGSERLSGLTSVVLDLTQSEEVDDEELDEDSKWNSCVVALLHSLRPASQLLLRSLELRSTGLTPEAASELRGLTGLAELTLSDHARGIDDVRALAAALRALSRLTLLSLEGLDIGPPVHADLAAALQALPELRVLSLARNELADQSLPDLQLPRLTRLQVLNLWENSFSVLGIRSLAASFSDRETIKRVIVSRTPGLSDEQMDDLFQLLPCIEFVFEEEEEEGEEDEGEEEDDL